MSDRVDPTVAGRNRSLGGRHHHGPHHGDDPEHQLVGLLLQAMRALGLHRPDPALPGVPVSVSEGLALAELRHRAPRSQQQLAERLQLDKSTVSRLIATLEQRGLVTHQRDPANRRWSQVTLTDRGRTAADQLIARFHQRHQRLVAAMTPQERAALATGLTALLRAAEQPPPPDHPPHRRSGALPDPEPIG